MNRAVIMRQPLGWSIDLNMSIDADTAAHLLPADEDAFTTSLHSNASGGRVHDVE
jgi:hypothetical protein